MYCKPLKSNANFLSPCSKLNEINWSQKSIIGMFIWKSWFSSKVLYVKVDKNQATLLIMWVPSNKLIILPLTTNSIYKLLDKKHILKRVHINYTTDLYNIFVNNYQYIISTYLKKSKMTYFLTTNPFIWWNTFQFRKQSKQYYNWRKQYY